MLQRCKRHIDAPKHQLYRKDTKTMTCKELFEDYSKDQKQRYPFHTYHPRINLLKNHFIPTYGEVDVGDITALEINKSYDSLRRKGYSPCTVFGLYATFNKFFKFAAKKGLIHHMPLEDAESVRPTKRRH